MTVEAAPKRQKLEAEYSELKDLPDELVIEILCRLPRYKYVFQCKCVSKHWLSLITSPYFIRSFLSINKKQQQQPWAFLYFKFMMKNFLRHSNFPYELADRKDASTLKLISQYPEFQPYEFSLEFLPCFRGEEKQEPITLLKSFNDLILCCAEKFDRSVCVYYICNPLTKQWVALPPTPPRTCVDVEFFCEPYYYTTDEGTVILNTQFKFKVVRCLCILSSQTVLLEIFSSETGQWNMTRISVPRNTQKSFIATSFLCKEKLILMMVDRWDPITSLSAITFDGCLNPSLKRVKFPGSKFCNSPYYSTMHLSSPQGRVQLVQICINYLANQGVPFLLIWELREEWKLRLKISFRHMASEDRWYSDFYLRKGDFVVEENGELRFHMPIVLGFRLRPYYRLYLNFNCDDRMGFYDFKYKTLKTWCHSSFPEYGFSDHMWSTVSEFVHPLWPTPVPQISKEPLAFEENPSM